MSHDLVIAIDGPSASEIEALGESNAYDEELDDVRSLLHDLCAALADVGRIRFVVQFAGEHWPVDVSADQLPGVKGLAEPFEIDFYEQGLERTLHFAPRGGEIDVHCTSRHATWTAPVTTVRLPR